MDAALSPNNKFNPPCAICQSLAVKIVSIIRCVETPIVPEIISPIPIIAFFKMMTSYPQDPDLSPLLYHIKFVVQPLISEISNVETQQYKGKRNKIDDNMSKIE